MKAELTGTTNDSIELEQLLNYSIDIICLFDYKRRFYKVSKSFEALLGYQRFEIIGSRFIDYVHSEDVEAVRQASLELRTENKDLANFTMRFRHKTGYFVTMDWSVSWDASHQTAFGIARDVTKIKAYERELIETNKKLAASEQIAQVGYWEASMDGSESYWSDETYKIWGQEKETFIPDFKNYLQTIHPEDISRFLAYQSRVMTHDLDQDFEYRIVRPDGTVRNIFQRTGIIKNETGDPFRLRGIAMDITERKQREWELYLTNERLNLLLQATNEAVWDWDATTETCICGDGFKKLFGLDMTERSECWSENIHPDDYDRAAQEFRKAIADRSKNSFYREYRYLDVNQQTAYVKDRCYILRDVHGVAIRAVGSIQDMTEYRKHTMEIERQNKRLKEIAWTQSHILRAPVARIMGLISLIQADSGVETASRDELINFIYQSAMELDQVVRDIVNETENINKVA